MPAKRIAAMGRSYRYPQADRRNCPQFAARQRGVWTTGDLLSNNPHGIDFMGYDAVCRSEVIREAFVHSRVFADKSAPTGSSKPTGAIAPQLAARQRGVWTTGKLLLDERQRNPGMCCAC